MKNKVINIFYFYYFDKAGNKNTMILTYYTKFIGPFILFVFYLRQC